MRPLALAAALAALAAPGRLVAQTVYTVGNDNSFGSITLSTGVYTAGSYTRISDIVSTYVALTSNGSGGLYSFQTAFDPDLPPDGNFNYILSTITTSGTASTVSGAAALLNMNGLALSAGGTLYAYQDNGGGSGKLGTVNTSDGTFTAIGTGVGDGLGYTGQIAFVGSTLYLADHSGLYSLNTTAGTASLIGSGGSDYDILNLLSDGSNLYGIGANYTFYSVSVADGSLTNLFTITGANRPGQFAGGYILLTPTPEPASVLGLSAAGLGLAGWVRRRRAAARLGSGRSRRPGSRPLLPTLPKALRAPTRRPAGESHGGAARRSAAGPTRRIVSGRCRVVP